MPTPYDYRIQVADPFQSAVKGLQLGSGIVDMQAAQQQRQIDMQKQQQEMANKQLLSERIMSVMDKPNKTASDFVGLAMLLPEKEAESMRKNWEVLGKDQQQAKVGQISEVMAALQQGRGDIAVERLKTYAEAARNSGDEQQAKLLDTHAQIAEKDPRFALTTLGFTMAALPGGKEALEGIDKMLGTQRDEAKAPAELSEAQSKAQKAAVDAKFAESNAVIDLQKKGWDITKIQSDIKIAKENSRIAALNAQISREGNGLKRQELGLKLAELQQKRDDVIRTKVADVESANQNIDNMLNTADRILKTPMGVVGSAAGPVSARMPTLSQDTADFEELVRTLGSQAFLAQIPNIKGMGALSNAEGANLQAALQNFSLRQSPERLIANVKEAQRLLLKARKNVSLRHGVPESVPDTPAAAGGSTDIDALVQKYSR